MNSHVYKSILALVVLLQVLVSTLHAQQSRGSTLLPRLGEMVPQSLVRTGPHQTCATNPPRRDPCATLRFREIVFTLAWDEKTKFVTYLFTNDVHFITDAELSVGGECRLSRRNASGRYTNWLVTPMWADTARRFSGEAKWYALLEKKDGDHGIIRGFVQSRFVESRFVMAGAPEY